jgi:hypothetical protein
MPPLGDEPLKRLPPRLERPLAQIVAIEADRVEGGRTINERGFARADEAGRLAPPPAGRWGATFGFHHSSSATGSVVLIASNAAAVMGMRIIRRAHAGVRRDPGKRPWSKRRPLSLGDAASAARR